MPKEFTPRAILVIDDEPLIQWAVSEALSQAGHDVVTAYTRSVCVPVIIRGRERRRVRPVRLRDVFLRRVRFRPDVGLIMFRNLAIASAPSSGGRRSATWLRQKPTEPSRIPHRSRAESESPLRDRQHDV